MAFFAMAAMPPPCKLKLKPITSHAAKDLSWRKSELAGTGVAVPLVVPLQRLSSLIVQPLASRVCELTGKKYNNARKISYSHIRTRKKQQPNLQYKRLWWEAGQRFVRLRICTQALKTIDKKGLDAMAKEAGIDLRKHR
ncbi:uncharacterized protein LOC9640894 [Selaginella moellendorffii]|nr:uncharacterized protein LOC9640894 [Selaginella moellendorffii]|eukprot:XP_002993335.2 uncharacterized protein LOC9640894 [Selaginella moellendorffii]